MWAASLFVTSLLFDFGLKAKMLCRLVLLSEGCSDTSTGLSFSLREAITHSCAGVADRPAGEMALLHASVSIARARQRSGPVPVALISC